METAARRKATLAAEGSSAEVPALPSQIDYGQVEVVRSVTVQVEQYHPVVTSVALRLPIDRGETAEQAIRRVIGIVDKALDPAVCQVVDDGFKWRMGGKARR